MTQAVQASSDAEQVLRDWHQLDSSTIAAALNTSPTAGLSATNATANRDQYGLNVLAETASRSNWSIWLSQLTTLPVALLTVAAGLCFFTGGTIDAVVIMGVVGINAIIGYLTESRSETIIQALKARGEQLTWVVRAGEPQQIATASVVPGDLLILKPNRFVAADARIIESQGLILNEAALTGESLPCEKRSDALIATETPLAERTNMVYKGTLITEGQGKAIAIATGAHTELGKIQQMVDTATTADTPLQHQLDTVGIQLVILSSTICSFVFGIGILRGYALLPMLKIAISLAVAAVPEGLPAIATTTLALGIREMRRHHILIRTLNAVEALGSLQTICLDKTGTITENKMAVAEVQVADEYPKQSEQLSKGKQTGQDDPHGLTLMQVAVLCNESQIKAQSSTQVNAQDKESWAIQGSATETALMEMALAADVNVVELRRQYPLLTTYPRSSTCPMMSTVHQVRSIACATHASPSNETQPSSNAEPVSVVAVKGNPTTVLAKCDRWQQGKRIVPLTPADRDRIEQQNQRMAGNALRVLGFAYGQMTYAETAGGALSPITDTHLIWLGLVGLADPIRSGVGEMITAFHQAGVKTVMITGDQGSTAYAIAKTLQLSSTPPITMLEATDLPTAPSLEPVAVFARVTPADKLNIVQTLQANGQVVAMTGDGINDTPALKTANVGIAMGAGSRDGVHDVADVVIADNHLNTLIEALSRGRTIYSNIRKSVHFLLSTNLSELMVITIMTTVAIGTPMTVMQLLWLNLVTDVFPGLALALEPPEPDVLAQPPRDPHEPIIKAADFGRISFEASIISLSALGGYGYGLWQYGPSLQADTLLFMGLTIAQVLHTLSCRSETRTLWSHQSSSSNPYVVVAIAFTLFLQVIPMVIPALSHLLSLAPLTLLDWLIATLGALLPLFVNEISKGLSTKGLRKADI